MTRRQMSSIAVAVLGLALLPGAKVVAAGFYSGIFGGVGMIDVGSKGGLDSYYFGEDFPVDSSLDDSDPAYGVQVGYRFNDFFAAEAGYVKLGQAQYLADFDDTLVTGNPARFTARLRSSGLTFSVLGIYPLGEQFDVYGRLGAYYSDTRHEEKFVDRTTGNSATWRADGNSIDPFLGLGATWNLNADWALRAEYQKFKDVGDDENTGEADADLLWFGVLFR